MKPSTLSLVTMPRKIQPQQTKTNSWQNTNKGKKKLTNTKPSHYSKCVDKTHKQGRKLLTSSKPSHIAKSTDQYFQTNQDKTQLRLYRRERKKFTEAYILFLAWTDKPPEVVLSVLLSEHSWDDSSWILDDTSL